MGFAWACNACTAIAPSAKPPIVAIAIVYLVFIVLSWFAKSHAERGKRPVAGSSKKKSKEIKPADGILAAVQNEIGEGASARPVRQLGINYTAGRMSAMRLGLRRL
jgi:hypothetical protein